MYLNFKNTAYKVIVSKQNNFMNVMLICIFYFTLLYNPFNIKTIIKTLF